MTWQEAGGGAWAAPAQPSPGPGSAHLPVTPAGMAVSPPRSGLFYGKSAWFACNVDADVKHLWFSRGGLVETVERADYVFSERLEDEELQQRLKQQVRQYPVAVFHPKFIEVVVKAQDFQAVPVGQFLVLPTALQAALRRFH